MMEQQFFVAIRIRPLNSREQQETLKLLDENTLVLLDPEPADSVDVLRKPRDVQFGFDLLFSETSDQRSVYERTALPLLEGVMEGYNGTVFAYGATGAGKTYTMTGVNDNQGIIPRTLNDLFRLNNNLTVRVSYLEIYNETIRDLLTSEERTLDLREDGRLGMVIAGLQEVEVSSTVEILNLLRIGNRNRAKEPTGANENSTRSHAILQIVMPNTNVKLSLVDLAGSERAAGTSNKGIRMLEGAKINQSLLVLGNCIQALCQKSKGLFVPYRGSKLTRLLKDSLGGNCRTVMIANVSPAAQSFEDTYNTLVYANRAKNITTTAVPQTAVQSYEQVIEQLRLENENLKKQLQSITQPKYKQPKLLILPSIIDTTTIDEHFKKEEELLKQLFQKENELDSTQLEILQSDDTDMLEHKRQKIQVLEVDWNDLNLQYKDLLQFRKKLHSQFKDQTSLLSQNELLIQNMQLKQQQKRGLTNRKQKEVELGSINKRHSAHKYSQERISDKSLLPWLKHKNNYNNLSQNDIKKKRYDYRDIQLNHLPDIVSNNNNNSNNNNDKNDIDNNKLQKQKSLAELPPIDVEQIKKIRLKRLNLQLQQQQLSIQQ